MILRAVLRASIIGVAAIAALVPLPASWVERAYSTSLYPRIQNAVTTQTNAAPVAFLDIAAALLILYFTWRSIRRVGKVGVLRASLSGLVVLLTWAAFVYLVFLAMWGLNYRRLPLEAKLDYDKGRVTAPAARTFAATATGVVNDLYGPAHATVADEEALARGFVLAQRVLGASRTAVPGVPRPSLLGYYFRYAAVDGMTDPIFLEIILNPDVLPVERPFVLAHEWAHLAGYADESEANFVAWLACSRADAAARYSGWLAVYQHTLSVIPRRERAALPPLGRGPLEDLRAMSERYQRSSPVVREAAREVYDGYLRANRVEAGIANYDLVVRLLVGTTFDQTWTPRMR
ncbi:MAG TPA: DUF3810 family protein [Vicinamibacterales bacterium]